VSKSVLEPPVIVRIVTWVGKISDCCGGSQFCGGGGLALSLFCWLVLFGVGYVICGTSGGYIIYEAGGGYVICGVTGCG
jgi:hypothetical protein